MGFSKPLADSESLATWPDVVASNLNWPPMTMSFKVKDKQLLDKLAVDKKVDFGFIKEGDDYVVRTMK